jgi:hypothetical protein
MADFVRAISFAVSSKASFNAASTKGWSAVKALLWMPA